MRLPSGHLCTNPVFELPGKRQQVLVSAFAPRQVTELQPPADLPVKQPGVKPAGHHFLPRQAGFITLAALLQRLKHGHLLSRLRPLTHNNRFEPTGRNNRFYHHQYQFAAGRSSGALGARVFHSASALFMSLRSVCGSDPLSIRTDGPITPHDLHTGANHEYVRCAVGRASPPQNGHGKSAPNPAVEATAPIVASLASCGVCVVVTSFLLPWRGRASPSRYASSRQFS